MTMRKYLVTIHEDGHVTALEYEEPADQALTNYQAGFREAVREILDYLECQKLAYNSNSREYVQLGKMLDGHDEVMKARAIYRAIDELKTRYRVFGTRR